MPPTSRVSSMAVSMRPKIYSWGNEVKKYTNIERSDNKATEFTKSLDTPNQNKEAVPTKSTLTMVARNYIYNSTNNINVANFTNDTMYKR
ncbi:hypothetical protein CHS0354_037624 [Potamilus streckersoni]|uniref:Uncharacterized protein n=1 Tax=Potamilus streckersoni TaxID=2493646 RepID=A0AAE0VKC1_9BIVA|nr:hypothetical protein CHS0354_037624 [Potamilus streckersoni]